VRLVSRNGNRFSSLTDLCAGIEFFLRTTDAVLDGEIACLDEHGCSQFNQLLFHRGTPRFCAFDLLWLNGEAAVTHFWPFHKTQIKTRILETRARGRRAVFLSH
jgi:ATP-dependent DNA ligase